jgi:CDP-glucose 4,6-dehydratase
VTEHAFGQVFAGRRVFVTGHTGFKGGWLALWLARLGAQVHGFALHPPTSPSLFEAARVGERLASDTRGDVRDFDGLTTAVRRARPEIVFHLAAQPLVRASYDDPRGTYETNVIGTVNILEAVRAVGGVRVCQVVTSDKCYENREWPYAYRENDAMGGHDPYSSSKGCAELAVSSWRRSFFALNSVPPTSLSSVRAGNVIGGGDWAADRIIPDCVRARARGVEPSVRNPNAIRPWQHVLEPLSGYLHLAMRQWTDPALFADSWNFGPGAVAAVPVKRLVELFEERWEGSNGTPARAGASQHYPAAPHEAHTLRLDITRAEMILDWHPILSIDEAVGLTADWYRSVLDDAAGWDPQIVCDAQIDAYTTRAEAAGIAWAASAEALA